MNKLFVTCIMSMVVSMGFGQRTYFVYLQTEAEQPFYVKLNEKVISSTSSGYVILSKLRDSTYDLSLGFPGNKWPEQKFSVAVSKKDHGYLVKDFGEKGWGLFDLQTLAVQMPGVKNEKVSSTSSTQDVNAFTNLLAKAADDSTIKEKQVIAKVETKTPEPPVKQPEQKDQLNNQAVSLPITKAEEKKADPEPVKNETLPVKQDNQQKPELKQEVKQEPTKDQKSLNSEILPPKIENPVKEEIKQEIKKEPVKEPDPVVVRDKEEIKTTSPYVKSKVTRKSESSTTEGFGLVFIDEYIEGKKDTIRILIPNDQPASGFNLKNNNKAAEKTEDKKFLDITTNDNIQKVSEKVNSNEVSPAKAGVKNPCKDVASDNDFLKLRKRMAAEITDDDMIKEAKKSFKLKCYSTEQIRNLSTLFLTSSGKYSFFDVSYGYVSDAGNFSLLQSELKEEYFLNRFKAMLRN